MKEAELKELLDSLTLDEKILQLLQVTGGFFGSGEQVLTGPAARLGLGPEQTARAGSVLSCVGAERTEEVQAIAQKHGKIPLLFMADVINGYRTILPIPLAQGCSFDEDLVRKGAEMAARRPPGRESTAFSRLWWTWSGTPGGAGAWSPPGRMCT